MKKLLLSILTIFSIFSVVILPSVPVYATSSTVESIIKEKGTSEIIEIKEK